jgi:hypothetical protein
VTRQQQVVRPQLSEEEKKKKVKELQVNPSLPPFPRATTSFQKKQTIGRVYPTVSIRLASFRVFNSASGKIGQNL